MLIDIAEGYVRGFATDGMSKNIEVIVDLWIDDSTYLGSVTMNMPKGSNHNAADIRANLPATLSAYLNPFGYGTPDNLWYTFDDEIVPASRTTGFAPVAISGAYLDLTGKPLIPSTVRTTSSLSLSLVGSGATGTQISATKDSTVRANVSTSTTASIGAAATSAVALKICATNNSSEGAWTTVATLENDQTITLALTLNSVQLVKGQLCADVPAGWFAKLVNTGTGTHTESFLSGQETIYG